MDVPVFTAGLVQRTAAIAAERSGHEPDADPDDSGNETLNLTRERALHERVKREQREFALATERGEYVPREAIRQASATLLAMVVQPMRSLADSLERQFSLSPEVCEAIDGAVNAALADMAKSLQAFTDG